MCICTRGGGVLRSVVDLFFVCSKGAPPTQLSIISVTAVKMHLFRVPTKCAPLTRASYRLYDIDFQVYLFRSRFPPRPLGVTVSSTPGARYYCCVSAPFFSCPDIFVPHSLGLTHRTPRTGRGTCCHNVKRVRTAVKSTHASMSCATTSVGRSKPTTHSRHLHLVFLQKQFSRHACFEGIYFFCKIFFVLSKYNCNSPLYQSALIHAPSNSKARCFRCFTESPHPFARARVCHTWWRRTCNSVSAHLMTLLVRRVSALLLWTTNISLMHLRFVTNIVSFVFQSTTTTIIAAAANLIRAP